MREYKFRGKAINREGWERSSYKDGDWVYGLITRNEAFRDIIYTTMIDLNGISNIEVDGKTLGQYTGYKDKYNTEIYEGDIVRCKFKDETGTRESLGPYNYKVNQDTIIYGTVIYDECRFYIMWMNYTDDYYVPYIRDEYKTPLYNHLNHKTYEEISSNDIVSSYSFSAIEVIGNIYDNKDLIKGK